MQIQNTLPQTPLVGATQTPKAAPQSATETTAAPVSKLDSFTKAALGGKHGMNAGLLVGGFGGAALTLATTGSNVPAFHKGLATIGAGLGGGVAGMVAGGLGGVVAGGFAKTKAGGAAAGGAAGAVAGALAAGAIMVKTGKLELGGLGAAAIAGAVLGAAGGFAAKAFDR